MKYYLEILADIHKSFQRDLNAGSDKLLDYLDKILVWIISLSTGSIALIFASGGKIDYISQNTINLTLLFLVVSIFSGVFGRGLNAISSYIEYNLTSMFDFQLKMIDIPYKPRKLIGDETAEIIYIYIKEDFHIDLLSILENKKTLIGNELDKYNEQIRKFYLEFTDAKKTEMDSAIKDINEIMIDSFGLNKDHFNKKKRKKNNKFRGDIMRICTKASLIFYGLSMLNFLIGVIYISIKYYCENK